MRLLHTSDWHLGLTLEGMPMLEHQRAALDFIIDVVRREDVDAVLISGDVYDRPLPSVTAIAELERALDRLAERCPVVVISGNHDSAVRLGFGSRLFSERLYLRTSPERIAEPVLLHDEYGPVAIYGIPYLDPDLTRHRLAEEPVDRSHEAVLRAAMARITEDLDRRATAGTRPRSVVLAHAFITGSTGGEAVRSDSERDIRVGNVDSAPAHLFEGIDYTALGHLHGPQQPAGATGSVVRYSGSPLRYSFSEARHRKSVTLVDLGPDGVKSVSTVDVPQPREMAALSGTLADLLDETRHTEHLQSWVKVTVTDPLRPEQLHQRLRQRFEHLVVALHQPPSRAGDARFAVASRNADPTEVLAQFVAEAQGSPATHDQREALRAALETVRREGESA